MTDRKINNEGDEIFFEIFCVNLGSSYEIFNMFFFYAACTITLNWTEMFHRRYAVIIYVNGGRIVT